jgi:hypothetical protein
MQLIPKDHYEITPAGEQCLKTLRRHWRAQVQTREVIRRCEQDEKGWSIVEVEEETTSNNARLNRNLPGHVFHRFAALVKEDDAQRINDIISAGQFEVLKALSVFEIAPMVVKDNKIQPASFDESRATGSPSLATLRKYKGQQKATDLIYMMLFGFVRKFGKRVDLIEDDILQIIQKMFDIYFFMTVADIKFILNDFKRRKGQKVFAMDYVTLEAIIDEGAEHRLQWGVNITESGHAKYKGNNYRIPTDAAKLQSLGAMAWEIKQLAAENQEYIASKK